MMNIRKAFLGFSLLVTSLTAGAQSATDYYVEHGSGVHISHAVHYPKTVSIVGTQSPRQELNDIASAIRCPAYFDRTETVFDVKSGDIVTPDIVINGEWMHGYVYVDWNGNKQFDVNLEGSGPYTAGVGNELMCWSHYNHASDDNAGWNSDGQPEIRVTYLPPVPSACQKDYPLAAPTVCAIKFNGTI